MNYKYLLKHVAQLYLYDMFPIQSNILYVCMIAIINLIKSSSKTKLYLSSNYIYMKEPI